MKNILIVGGAGYIGSHTVLLLQQNGYNCVVVDNLIAGHKEAVTCPLEIGDIRDKQFLSDVFDKYQIEAVIHFAAFAAVGESVEKPEKYYSNNVVGTLSLLEVMRQHNVDKIVFSSTCATYGMAQYVPLDENHPQKPLNPYGQTKLVVEKVLEEYRTAYGLKYVALRYFNACGAWPDGSIGESKEFETMLIPSVFSAILGKRPYVTVFGTDYDTMDGTGVRDYIHVCDLASAHQKALENLDNFSGCLNVGTGIGHSVLEIIQSAERVTGKKCPVQFGPRRAGDAAKVYADASKIKQLFGWEAKYTDLDEIMQTVWNWMQKKRY